MANAEEPKQLEAWLWAIMTTNNNLVELEKYSRGNNEYFEDGVTQLAFYIMLEYRKMLSSGEDFVNMLDSFSEAIEAAYAKQLEDEAVEDLDELLKGSKEDS